MEEGIVGGVAREGARGTPPSWVQRMVVRRLARASLKRIPRPRRLVKGGSARLHLFDGPVSRALREKGVSL